MLRKLAEFLGQEVEVWTMENTEPWMGILKGASPEYVTLLIDELETYLVTDRIVAFRLSEGEQEAGADAEAEAGEGGAD